MDRRMMSRQARRLEVRLKPKGTAKVLRGYTTNISDSGTYVNTHGILPKGTRVLVELREKNQAVLIEAEVARCHRSFHAQQPSGMGLRFLDVSELVQEVLPRSGEIEGELLATRQRTYRLTFPDRKQLVEAYEKDLETGGLFIPTDQPPALGETVTVELALADLPSKGAVKLDAKVVQRLLPTETPGPTLVGMGVELLSFEKAKQAVERLLVDSKPG